MDVTREQMDDGASFDDAHDTAMNTVGAGSDSDDNFEQYLEGGAY